MNLIGTLLIILILLIILVLPILFMSLVIIDKELISLFNKKNLSSIKYLGLNLDIKLKEGVVYVNYKNISLKFFIFLEVNRLIKIIK